MSDKTSTSNANSYQDIGEFWDKHDATEFGEQTNANFNVNITSQRKYFPLDKHLFIKVKQIAKQHGISEETLLNLWIQEKINQVHIVKS